MPMTKRQALRKAAKIWKWLSKNPTYGKKEAYSILGLEKDLHDCPLCEWAAKRVTDTYTRCSCCPTWPGDKLTVTCEYKGFYEVWRKLRNTNADVRSIAVAAKSVWRDIRLTKGY